MEIKRLTKEELQNFTRLKDCKIENLYYRGDISLLQKPDKIIALIGRRNADADVLRNANRCGKILTESGAVTLNGLAVGCDTAGLEGALAAGGKCIAVMPCGLDYIYPKCNDSLVENILKNGGCIVSKIFVSTCCLIPCQCYNAVFICSFNVFYHCRLGISRKAFLIVRP